MAHLPHLYVPPPWDQGDIPLTADARHHLGRVLRRGPGSAVTYTDGAGTVGAGHLGDACISRGDEVTVPRPHLITCAVAPPHRTERARFVVEKLAELGIDRLVWLRSRRTSGSPPRSEKSAAWAVAALEQSRGAHLMEVGGPVDWDELGDADGLVVADAGGGSFHAAVAAADGLTIAIGPEGGFDDAEIPAGAARLGLGDRILRTETAAVVAAGLVLERLRHPR